MKLEDFLTGMSRDLKEVIKQTTITNGRVSSLESYNEQEVKPVVKAFNNQQAVNKYTLKQKALRWSLACAFGVALLTAVWNAGYWAFQHTIDGIVERENRELVEKIDKLNDKLQDMEFNINIEDL